MITRITVSSKNLPYLHHLDSMVEYVEGWRFWAEEPVKYVEYYDTASGMDCRDEFLVIDGERYIGTIMTERVS